MQNIAALPAFTGRCRCHISQPGQEDGDGNPAIFGAESAAFLPPCAVLCAGPGVCAEQK